VNIGVHDGILDQKHVDAMGAAVFLYLWCLRHQTKHNGLVLGGAPITYAQINKRLGQPERTLQRWMQSLVAGGYLELTYLNYKMMRIRILKSKKFNYKQIPLKLDHTPKMADSTPYPSAKNGGLVPPKMADSTTKNGGSKQSVIVDYIESTPTPHPALNVEQARREIEALTNFRRSLKNQERSNGKETAGQARLRRAREVARQTFHDVSSGS
jgi:hypothetical protein